MALTFSSARSRSVICFASLAMREAFLLEPLAEPTPGTRDAAHAKRRGLDGRQRWGVGCRRDGGLRESEVADRAPSLRLARSFLPASSVSVARADPSPAQATYTSAPTAKTGTRMGGTAVGA